MTEHNPTMRPKHIGARVQRLEDPRLLAGRASFVDDRQAPGMLHVAFRRSDQAHARIVGFDCAEAKSLPGVIGIYRLEDLQGLARPALPTSKMRNYYATPIYPLARGKVRYVGEPVVAVVAESRYVAEDALDLVNLELAPLPGVCDPEAALATGATLLHEEAGTNVIVEREFRRGDVAAALAAASVRVKGRFRFRRKSPVAIENRAYLGGLVAVALMLWTPLGESVEGIWWAIAAMLLVRGVVLLAGYRRSATTAVRS
jgi:carbon-monoxide dehydrogenase large subunit